MVIDMCLRRGRAPVDPTEALLLPASIFQRKNGQSFIGRLSHFISPPMSLPFHF
jgi:hypothetical protein